MIDLMYSQVREQALWALGNFAGESPQLRDNLLEIGVLGALLQLLEMNPSVC